MTTFDPIPTSNLPEDLQSLVAEALVATKESYCPYSDFQVGCALRTEGGKVYRGANFENAAYSPCICAERCAISAAVAAGDRLFDVIAVVGRSLRGGSPNGSPAPPVAPCGVCRQTLWEFRCIRGKDIIVLCANSDGSLVVKTDTSALLPLAFGPTYVQVDVSGASPLGRSER